MIWFKNNWFTIIGFFLVVVLLFIYLNSNYGVMGGLKKYFKISVSNCEVIKKEDTHGGFHGDGDLTAILDCSKFKQNIYNKKNCFSLPVEDEYIIDLIDSYELNKAFNYNSSEDFDLTKIQNGFYCFYGRNLHDDGSSYKHYLNFDLTIYNSDNNILYYYDSDM